MKTTRGAVSIIEATSARVGLGVFNNRFTILPRRMIFVLDKINCHLESIRDNLRLWRSVVVIGV